MLVAIRGTTMSPYLFFLPALQEEKKAAGSAALTDYWRAVFIGRYFHSGRRHRDVYFLVSFNPSPDLYAFFTPPVIL